MAKAAVCLRSFVTGRHDLVCFSCYRCTTAPSIKAYNWNGCHLSSIKPFVLRLSSEELDLTAFSSPSFRYNGANPTTNMVVVDFKLLSGFTADTSLVRMRLKDIQSQNTWSCFRCKQWSLSSQLGSPPDSLAPLVQRVDAGDDHVLVYLKEVRCAHLPSSCVYAYVLFIPFCLAGSQRGPHDLQNATETGSCSAESQASGRWGLWLLSAKYAFSDFMFLAKFC